MCTISFWLAWAILQQEEVHMYMYIPYRQKIWWGINFGSLADWPANCQVKIRQHSVVRIQSIIVIHSQSIIIIFKQSIIANSNAGTRFGVHLFLFMLVEDKAPHFIPAKFSGYTVHVPRRSYVCLYWNKMCSSCMQWYVHTIKSHGINLISYMHTYMYTCN